MSRVVLIHIFFSGGISIAWVMEHNCIQIPEVAMLQPYTSEDFRNTRSSIGDIIKDMKECTHLYPNIPKETVFGRFCTSKWQKYLSMAHVRRRRINGMN